MDEIETFITDEAGIKIPASLAANMIERDMLEPNGWNPNKMDAFVRERLIRAIKKDGFIVPVIVRPNPDGEGFQIIDGEHRWLIAGEIGMPFVPFVNVGAISDDDAKAITIKANTLSGEFDSIGLAKIIKELAESSGGLTVLAEELPYTHERLSGMIALLDGSGDFKMPEGMGGSGDDDDGPGEHGTGKSAGASAASEFKEFNPADMEFDHECPRCKFKFNTAAGA